MAVNSMRWSPCGQTENVIDEHGLAGDVVFRCPPHLPLANHVHCFDLLKCSPGRVERSESLWGVGYQELTGKSAT